MPILPDSELHLKIAESKALSSIALADSLAERMDAV
jgi:hypothetical protein